MTGLDGILGLLMIGKLVRILLFLLYTGLIFAAGAWIGQKPGIVRQGVSVIFPERQLSEEGIIKLVNEFRTENSLPVLENHNGLNKMAQDILDAFNETGKPDEGPFLKYTKIGELADKFCSECYKYGQNLGQDFTRADYLLDRWKSVDRESFRNLRDSDFNYYGIALDEQFVVFVLGATP